MEELDDGWVQGVGGVLGLSGGGGLESWRGGIVLLVGCFGDALMMYMLLSCISGGYCSRLTPCGVVYLGLPSGKPGRQLPRREAGCHFLEI